MNPAVLLLAVIGALVASPRGMLAADGYDPLAVPQAAKIETLDLTVTDKSREREIPIRVYLPAGKQQPATVVLFSHGLGGSREGSAFLGKHWAARGYAAVFLQHPGSDDSVWRDEPLAKRMAALREAASGQNLLLRVRDVPAVLDQLETWNRETGHTLAGQLDLSKVGMSGHSFGGQTTQAVSGQSLPLVRTRLSESRIKAAVVMSPSTPRAGDPKRAFGDVELPWLLMTGTHDTALIGGQTVESRRDVYPALPAGDKFELVLNDAEHSAFTERPLPGDKQARNPNHHRVILATSTAFWDAYLLGDKAAKAWLTGDGPSGVMEEKDVWQKK